MAEQSYKDVGKKLADAERYAENAAKNAWKEYVSQNPELTNNAGIKVGINCFVKRPAGFSKVVPAIAERLMWKGWCERTQLDILKEVKPLFPEQKLLPNIWTKKFTKWERDRVKTLVTSNASKPISLQGCDTLSELKKRISAANKLAGADQVIKATISITKDAVVVNKKEYPIEKIKSEGYEYNRIRITVGAKRQWLRLDTLLAFLDKS